jgi:hypothetical protein
MVFGEFKFFNFLGGGAGGQGAGGNVGMVVVASKTFTK